MYLTSFSGKNLIPVQNTVSPSLQALVVNLERFVREKVIKKLLDERDDITALDQRKLIPESSGLLASMLCPSVRDKIHFYETTFIRS